MAEADSVAERYVARFAAAEVAVAIAAVGGEWLGTG